MFVEGSAQYMSFSSRKQHANAGTERKQFTENASVALQQSILTHAHTKCPPVPSTTVMMSGTMELCRDGHIKNVHLHSSFLVLTQFT